MSEWHEREKRRTQWLATLGAGDEVAVYHSGIYGHYTFEKVTRTTNTCLVIGLTKYRKKDGHEQGQFSRNILQEPTAELKQEEHEKRRRRELENILNGYKWNRL